MPDSATPAVTPPIPPDDASRALAVARPDTDQTLPHVGLVGDTYTILLRGEDTAGRFALIDMHVPSGGGPPPHRHDFEETFMVLEGEIELEFRGATSTLRAGETANVPANAPHAFRNAAQDAARMLCLCAPAGQEELFLAVGARVGTRTEAAPRPSEAEQAALIARVQELAPRYRTELLGP